MKTAADIIIETERLYMRTILPDDVQGMFEMDSDPEVHRFLGKNPINSLQAAASMISYIRQQYADFGIGRLAIIEKETGAFLGWGGLKFIKEHVNGHQDYYDLGYRFLKRHWGKGFASECSKAVIDYAFNELKLNSIYAIADMQHLASRNVLEKCGFSFVNTFEYDGDPHAWYELHAKHY